MRIIRRSDHPFMRRAVSLYCEVRNERAYGIIHGCVRVFAVRTTGEVLCLGLGLGALDSNNFFSLRLLHRCLTIASLGLDPENTGGGGG